MCSENDNRENTLFKNHEEILTMGKQIKSLNENVTKLLDDLKDSSNPQSKEFLHGVNNLDDYDASSANDFTSSSNSSLTVGVQPELITLDD
ncbi:hypothetical protein CEXT_135591 [Caerostris extrusa]|uniref:Uncharacterized protein n=1 Tax=Caerostris extrusa TaxID=172846 RepID=A0AAV4QX96_CAEEX|nr:hypothetical protein CEXT_135591 [Caerostris extrusa]